MKVIQKITLFAVLLLLPAVAQAQTPQTLQGMTIFDSNSIHIENNSLTTHNIFTVVLTDKDAPVAIAFNSTPPPEFIELDDLKPLKKASQSNHKPVAKTPKTKEKNISPTVISWSNSPYGNSSLYIVANNSCAIVPTTNNKQQTTQFVCLAERSRSIPTVILQVILQKQQFQTSEIVFKSSNYSKTSRIRPPPYC